MSNTSTSTSSSSEETIFWIPWYCNLKGNKFFCQIDEAYIKDGFNLTGLNKQVPFYKKALETILDLDDDDENDQQQNIDEAAQLLYGLIHARYILTNDGIAQMLDKYQKGDFGYCPRVFCESQNMLPVGLSDERNVAMVKLYCPKCKEVYNPDSWKYDHTDGAFFGTSFPHMLFMVHPEYRPPPPTETYVPRLFGFKVEPQCPEQSPQNPPQVLLRTLLRTLLKILIRTLLRTPFKIFSRILLRTLRSNQL